ncbi:MAG: hypothetical protein KME42_19720 [Tildeniella nuda ZEHNDER 1965/U140]|jgi:uncharacterized coiled-coil protein SlyX|nr:hypothetical protein [Tildeniella nuda ZEHNDER 1965/U140]
MTQSNDTPNRLDRIEAILEQLVERTNENTQQLTITMQSVDRLANIQIEAFQAIGTLQQLIADTQQSMSEMQSEVRGLQTENRRILDILQHRNGGN